ncbi:PREDICTED: protein PML [Leptosomus discolor]|uniref:protein PML n=1 Tax=Leptosomus discolor TaxID=188344 RepID=UPI000522D1D8|nr:PREDICTED: protein PML [Leptosomus discolor]
MDNLLFTNLQARLSIYKKIRDSNGPSGSRCRGETAAVWCSECEFLCTKCFEDHQWFFKKRSHEARKVEELRAESAHQFLEDTRKSCNLFCSRPGHADQGQISSIYCKKCEKALCCSCALLDSQHAPFCDIRSETQRRQEELGTMSQELKPKRKRGRQELQRMAGVLRRMEASERLVEKMRLYATEREVMDMQPFIKNSLEQLQQLQPPAAKDRAQPGNFAECRARLQALVERVMGHPGTNSQAVPAVEVALEKNPQGESVQPESQTILPTFTISLGEMQMSPAVTDTAWPRRRLHCVEKGSQVSPKVLKLECDNMPDPSDPSSNQWDGKKGPSTSMPGQNCSSIPAARSRIDDPEDTSIIISSSEDSEEDMAASSKPKDSKKPSSPTWSGSGTSPHHSTGPTSPCNDRSELSTLVFLSLKVDHKTQHIMEVAAANGKDTFKTMIQTPESILALFSQGVPMEVGMQHLLWYLSSLPRPVLIVYNFWGPELPTLFKALDATDRKVDFCHIAAGYVDMLSLIKEKLPEAPSYKLQNLLRRHLQQQLNEGSALTTAKALQELWEALKLPACIDAGIMLTHCNLQSYTILRPLVQEKLLTRRALKILARRNLILWELEQA